MRAGGRGFAAALLLLAACTAPTSSDDARQEVWLDPPPPTPTPSPDPPPPPSPEPPAREVTLACSPAATQGGAILCRTRPGFRLMLDGRSVAISDPEGLAVIGLARDQASPAVVSVRWASGEGASAAVEEWIAKVDVAPRHDQTSTLSLDCNKISPQSAAEKRRAEAAWIRKEAAWKTFSPPLAPVAFTNPVPSGFPASSSFGATRTYEPKTKACKPTVNVHNGTDFSVPAGAEITAPMAGTVILADPDLYYEGQAVFLDHGRGLVSVMMHMSRIDVVPGQVVKQGDVLGLSGATGRVTGPHLHWAVKFRNVTSDDRAADIWIDPVLLLQLDSRTFASE